jgi:hypothetical protein
MTISTQAQQPKIVMSTEAQRPKIVMSTEAQQSKFVIPTEAQQHNIVISTEAQRSGEICFSTQTLQSHSRAVVVACSSLPDPKPGCPTIAASPRWVGRTPSPSHVRFHPCSSSLNESRSNKQNCHPERSD